MGAATNKQVTVTDLVEMMYDLYPGIQDTRADFGFEHAVAAVGVVLLGAAMLGTIDRPRLARFTRYSQQFIAAIAFNMQKNRLWLNGRYDTSTWLHDDGSIEDRGLINHVTIAYGDRNVSGVDGKINTDPCQIYWYEHRGQLVCSDRSCGSSK